MIDRTPKPCHHPKADHQHGDLYAYIRDGCRCFKCSLANNRYRTQLKRNNRYGLGNFVDAEPARQHVEALRNAGWGVPRIIQETGVTNATMTRLIWGYSGRPRSRQISTVNYDRIMAVPLPATGDLHYIPTIGVLRRLQGLATRGWSTAELSRRAGVYQDTFGRAGRGEYCLPSTYRALLRIYDELWDKEPPTETLGQKIVAARTKANAQRSEWHPPLAWDDDTIDDPNATPQLGQREINPLTVQAEERFHVWAAEFEDLINDGRTLHEAVAEFGLTIEAAYKRFHRWAPNHPMRQLLIPARRKAS